jgi:hypothetical protein
LPDANPEISSVVALNALGPDHEKAYGVVPPVTVILIAPFVNAGHVALVTDDVKPRAAGCVIVFECVEVHACASVIVTLYVPAINPEISSAVETKAPGPVHAKVYGAVPPTGDKLIEPFVPALQEILFPLNNGLVEVALNTAAGCVIETVDVTGTTQPLLSVTVTV